MNRNTSDSRNFSRKLYASKNKLEGHKMNDKDRKQKERYQNRL